MKLVVEWGSVAEWVSGVGTLLAFLITFILAIRELRLQRMARRDDEVRQARLVVIGEPAFAEGVVFVSVHNFSDQPIYEVKSQIAVTAGGRPAQEYQSELAFLAPGERHMIDFEVARSATEGISVESPVVYFLDNSGRWWRRSASNEDPERRFSALTPRDEAALREALKNGGGKPLD